ncbi:MAG: hypothetical protein ACI90V_011012 [Bacillariaceae sp.]|jgi:hypothetical protein
MSPIKTTHILILVCLLSIAYIVHISTCCPTGCWTDFTVQTVVKQSRAHLQNVADGSRTSSIERSLSVWRKRALELVLKLSPAKVPDQKVHLYFFHIRKGGGSTLLAIISKAAEKHNVSVWRPCNGEPCVPFSLPPRKSHLAVYASRVNFVHMTQLFREIGNGMNRLYTTPKNHKKYILEDGTEAVVNSLDDSYPLFDCMTNLRPTVSCVISCWNFQFVQSGSASKTWEIPTASNLTAQDWNTLLLMTYNINNNGCNNENARIFGCTADETVVNTLMLNDPIFLDKFEKAASRMSRCVIVMTRRCQESNTIIRHFLPWLND